MSHYGGLGGGKGTDGRQRVAEGAMLVRLETMCGCIHLWDLCLSSALSLEKTFSLCIKISSKGMNVMLFAGP